MADPVVEEIKRHLDIVEVINQYLPLKRSGINFKALCPFHSERTPSFMVNRERQIWRCFGCGEAGDVLAFVMKQENIDFPTALRMLAERAGVPLPAPSQPRGRGHGLDKTLLLRVNNLASQFFHQVLIRHPAGQKALASLKKRGISETSISQFTLGFAPARSEALLAWLAKQALPPRAIQLAGGPDRFRGRIIFPLRDVLGQVIGFAGRSVTPEQTPKYLNSPDTSLFHKSRYLYGLFEAKKAIAGAKRALLVEGQIDCVLAHQAGTDYTLATSGTALSDDHLRIIRRYTDSLYLALDNDEAGRKATLRAIQLALPHGFDLAIIGLAEGSDPGETITQRPAKWVATLAKPQPAIDWLFGYFFSSGEKPSVGEREQIYEILFPYIALNPDPVGQSYALQHLSLLLGLTQPAAVHAAFAAWRQPKRRRGSPPGEPPAVQTAVEIKGPKVSRERKLLGLILFRPDLLQAKEFGLKEDELTTPPIAHLYKATVTWYNQTTNHSSEALMRHLAATASGREKQALDTLLFDTQTEVADFTPEQLLQEYVALVQALRKQAREGRIQQFAHEIAQAEANKDRTKILALIKEINRTIKQES